MVQEILTTLYSQKSMTYILQDKSNVSVDETDISATLRLSYSNNLSELMLALVHNHKITMKTVKSQISYLLQ